MRTGVATEVATDKMLIEVTAEVRSEALMRQWTVVPHAAAGRQLGC
jgi:hypothetical protein